MKIKWKFVLVSTLIVAIVVASMLFFLNYYTHFSFERALGGYHIGKGIGPQFRKKFFDGFRKSLILGGIVGVTFSFILSIFFSRFIEDPVKRLKNALKRVSEGDFNVNIEPKSNDEIGELTKEFNQMVKKLKELDEIRRDLVLQITHEISTPLTSMMGYLEAIEDGIIKGEEKERALKTIKRELKRLTELVNEVREFSTIESINFKLKREWFDLKEEVKESLEIIKKKWKDKKINVRFSCKDEKIMVFLDRKRVRQILLNLLDNAFKFTKPYGNVEVEVKKEGGKKILVIKDKGIGIDKKDIENVFKKFYRVRSKSGKEVEGTGLGLYIVKKLVEAHNGIIEIKSKKGEGTEVKVVFP